jgi:hypothetical protein
MFGRLQIWTTAALDIYNSRHLQLWIHSSGPAALHKQPSALEALDLQLWKREALHLWAWGPGLGVYITANMTLQLQREAQLMSAGIELTTPAFLQLSFYRSPLYPVTLSALPLFILYPWTNILI